MIVVSFGWRIFVVRVSRRMPKMVIVKVSFKRFIFIIYLIEIFIKGFLLMNL